MQVQYCFACVVQVQYSFACVVQVQYSFACVLQVHLDDDDILSWWAGASANGLPTLRKLARRVLAIPATCSHAHDIGQRAKAAVATLPLHHRHRLNDILHVTYNLN